MSLRTLALDWSLDGPIGLAFGWLLAAAGFVYLFAAKIGTTRDRRRRPWPRGRTVCFLAGLAVLMVDLYFEIGTEADTRLSVHMTEHMVMWVVVAPLLAAGAPLRLAFFALPRAKRRALTRWLHARRVSALTGPVRLGVAVHRSARDQPPAGRLRPGAPQRLRPRSRARPLPPDGAARVGAATRRRAATASTRTARPARLHGRVQGADGSHRGLAGNRAGSRLPSLPPIARSLGASRPTRGSDDHVGRMPTGVCSASLSARSNAPPASPTARALTPRPCVNREGFTIGIALQLCCQTSHSEATHQYPSCL